MAGATPKCRVAMQPAPGKQHTSVICIARTWHEHRKYCAAPPAMLGVMHTAGVCCNWHDGTGRSHDRTHAVRSDNTPAPHECNTYHTDAPTTVFTMPIGEQHVRGPENSAYAHIHETASRQLR